MNDLNNLRVQAQRLKDDGARYVPIDPASVLGLLDQLEAAQKDVEMMDWLSDRLVCADFDYQDSGESVVVFEWPDDAPISADVRSSISSAMQSTN